MKQAVTPRTGRIPLPEDEKKVVRSVYAKRSEWAAIDKQAAKAGKHFADLMVSKTLHS